MSDFPTDEMTLRLLIEACQINPDTEQTHLHDFLMMGTQVASETLTEEGSDEPGLSGAPVYFVEYEPGLEPHSPQSVIATLAREILALRRAVNAKAKPERSTDQRKEKSDV